MRRVYLIRHGKPELPGEGRFCVGRTDIPLCTLGGLQACLAGAFLEDKNIRMLFSSPLRRAQETARAMGMPYTVLSGLEEQDMGAWDGLSFERIRKSWPELYARRGEDPMLVPAGAERPEHCRERFGLAVGRALEQSEGDIAIVAHVTVLQTFLCGLLELPLREYRGISIPYGSVTTLVYENDSLKAETIGASPVPPLTRVLCLRLLQTADACGRITDHCQAVAEEALRIAGCLERHGIRLDRNLIEQGALLHDIARATPGHARVGAQWLRELGYGAAAALTERHEELEFSRIDEAAVVFIADKCIRETGWVSLEERFARSAEKCGNDDAVQAHGRKYHIAKNIQKAINTLCSEEVVGV